MEHLSYNVAEDPFDFAGTVVPQATYPKNQVALIDKEGSF